MIFLRIRTMIKKIILTGLFLAPSLFASPGTTEGIGNLEALDIIPDSLTETEYDESSPATPTRPALTPAFPEAAMEAIVREEDPQGLGDVAQSPGTVTATLGNFDVGTTEKELLRLSRFVEGRIPDNEWNEIAAKGQTDRYIVQEGDWLWKISQRLFGSGFYYSKIWSLNPQITNPHEIEPGLVLLFNTGNPSTMPQVALGTFDQDLPGALDTPHPWPSQRERLIKGGIHFEYTTGVTHEDLDAAARALTSDEHKKYTPIIPEYLRKKSAGESLATPPQDFFQVQQAEIPSLFPSTFITTNALEDVGFIDSFKDEKILAGEYDLVFVRFLPSVIVNPGDIFSVYTSEGTINTEITDRRGQRYNIVAKLKTVKQIDDVWECRATQFYGMLKREDRITSYIPPVSMASKVFSPRIIEAAIIGSEKNMTTLSGGDIIYADRGRLDGVEVGTVFSIYDFFDRGTGKRITPSPTYRIGEFIAISVTDNFSTAIVSEATDVIEVGHLAFTTTEEEALALAQERERAKGARVAREEKDALEELDVEINVENLSNELLEEASKVELSRGELEELQRQEQAASVLKEHERDVLELEKLEQEISMAEASINELKVDEDKFLEQQDLDVVERVDPKNANAFKDINEIEKDIGRKYMDEDINSRDNPYGLTAFDLEEIDELLNTESL